MKKQAYNPYLPLHEYIPDGEPRVFGDRLYVYGSHDKEGGDFFCMLDYVTYSAPLDDLTDWRYEGVIYSPEQDPAHVRYPYLYAPDVTQGNDGRYYLYYSLSDKGEASYLTGVAVSDTPGGRFSFLGYVRYPDGTPVQDYVVFDPGILNDDGVIRLYYGFWHDFPTSTPEERMEKQMRIFRKTKEEILSTPGGIMGPVTAELEDDMLTVKAKPRRILSLDDPSFAGHRFFEGSSMRKIGDKYYFIYSSCNNHELCYATSDYPDRGFTFGGVIVSNGDIGYRGRLPEDRLNRTGNTHGSIACVKDQWYVFYHRQTHKNEFSRQACAEKIEILPDGSIPQVEMTSCGLNGKALVPKGSYPAVICCNLTNGHLPHGACPDAHLPHITSRGGERFIAEVEDGTVIGYKYFTFAEPTTVGVTYQNGSRAADGKLQIKTTMDGETLGEILLSDNVNWSRAEATVNVPDGDAPLYLVYRGHGECEISEIYFR